MKQSTHLRRSVFIAALTVAAALLSVTAATFAWYVYNTSARTTQVKMAAGSSVSLQISSTPEGPYSSSAVMQTFTGRLVPVSTDRIAGGFQKVEEFAQEDTRMVASKFLSGVETVDYYKTSLYLKTTAPDLDIYLSDISFEDAEFETLNGFMISKLDRIPEPDEKFDVDYQGYHFKILSVENKMIQSVLVTKLSEETVEQKAEEQSVLDEKQK